MLKFIDNPPILSPETELLADFDGRWWVAHTKSRFEKALAWNLFRHNISYFLPMLDRVRISGGKKRRMLMPLFPSYVFFCGTEEHCRTVMETNRVCQIVEVVDQFRLIEELGAIAKVLQNQTPLDPYPHLAEGNRCRITAGAFEGIEGVVVQRNRTARIVLSVGILAQGAVIEIDADLLEPLN